MEGVVRWEGHNSAWGNLYQYAPNALEWVDPWGGGIVAHPKGFSRRDRITKRWTVRLSDKKPEDIHHYLTSKGWERTYPQGDRLGEIQHTAYVKTTKSGSTYKLDYHATP